MLILELFFIVLFGLCLGSFVTMASYRLPLAEDIVFKASHCVSCNHSLGLKDLVPLFSWIISGGKCRYCKKKISPRYPSIEITTAALVSFMYFNYGATLLGLCMVILSVLLMIMIVTDFEHKIIPDFVQIALIPVGIFYGVLQNNSASFMIAGFLTGLIIALSLRYGFLYIRKKDALGMGDVKFFAVAGIFLGVKSFVPFMFFSGIIGIFISLFWRIIGKGERFPFGPALAVSLLFCIIFPNISDKLFFLHELLFGN